MVQTSRVFATFDRLVTVITAATFPAHSITGTRPTVVIEGMGLDDALERVVLQPAPVNPSELDFASLSNARHYEDYVYQIGVSSLVDGSSMVEVKARIAAIVAVIETTLRNQTTGMPAGGFDTITAGERLAEWWKVTRIAPDYWPGTEGYYGECAVDVFFRSRI